MPFRNIVLNNVTMGDVMMSFPYFSISFVISSIPQALFFRDSKLCLISIIVIVWSKVVLFVSVVVLIKSSACNCVSYSVSLVVC